MFPDKCLGFRLELVDEFTKIVLSTFGLFLDQLCVYIILLCYKNQKFSKLFKNTLYTCKQLLMIAYEKPESAQTQFW